MTDSKIKNYDASCCDKSNIETARKIKPKKNVIQITNTVNTLLQHTAPTPNNNFTSHLEEKDEIEKNELNEKDKKKDCQFPLNLSAVNIPITLLVSQVGLKNNQEEEKKEDHSENKSLKKRNGIRKKTIDD